MTEKKKAEEKQSFEQALARLEKIVDEMDSGELDLDKMVDQGLQQVSERMEGVKEDAQDVRNRVERQVSEQLGRAKDTVNAQVGEGGRVQLQLEPALEVNTCFAEFLRFPDGRRSVVQFRTYRAAETETFPSVFVRCLTQATDPAELSGVTLEAEIFVQREAGGEVRTGAILASIPRPRRAAHTCSAFHSATKPSEAC